MKFTWITTFVSAMKLSSNFAAALDEQLAMHARQLAGIDLRCGKFNLAPLIDSGIKYKRVGNKVIGNVESDIVCPDGMGYPVVISWFSIKNPQMQIDPRRKVDSSDELRIYWTEFPVSELTGKAGTFIPPVTMNTPFSFPLIWRTSLWPDIRFNIYIANSDDELLISKITAEVSAAIELWNNQKPNRGKIHYCSEIKYNNEGFFDFHTDFGSAERDVFEFFIKHITRLDFLNIEKIILE